MRLGGNDARAGGPGRLSNLLRNMRQGLFGTMLLMSKKQGASSSSWETYIDVGVRTAQMFSFVVSSRVGAPWPQAMVVLTSVSSFFSFEFLSIFYRRQLYEAAWYGSYIWVILTMLLLLYGVVAFSRNSFPFLWPLRLLRLLGQLSATIAFIPLLNLLLSSFQCGTRTSNLFWSDGNFACSSSGFIAVQALSAVLAILLTCLSMLFSGLFYDPNSLSRGLGARAHGRVDVIMLLIQTVLVLVAQTFVELINIGIVIAILAGAGVLWLAAFLWTMPFYAHAINAANVAAATAYLWAVICCVLNNYYPGTDAAIMLYVGLPFAAMAGLQMANWRVNSVLRKQISQLASPYEVELRARFILATAVWGHPFDRRSQVGFLYGIGSMGNGRGGSGTGGSRNGGGTLAQGGLATAAGASASAPLLRSSRHGAGAGANGTAVVRFGGADGGSIAENTSPAGVGGGNGHGGGTGGSSGGPSGALDDAADVLEDGEDRIAALRRLIPQAVLADVQALFKQATSRFRGSAVLHVFTARFYATYMGNRHLQLSHLLQAERRSPPVDISYIVFKARRDAEDGASGASAGGSGGSGKGAMAMTALSRVAFEKFSALARRQVLVAGSKQLAFWTELSSAQPDLSVLHKLSKESNEAMMEAEAAFAELLAINPQSLPVLRLAAAHNLYVACNAEKAGVLSGEADRLEDQRSKDARAEGSTRLQFLSESSLDVWSDAAAVISLSAAQRSLGTILAVNAGACRLLGYSRLQLERRSAFSLLPAPFDSWVEEQLRTYLLTGEGSLVGSTRVGFALHKGGYVLPVLFSFRDAPSDEGPATFILVARDLRSSSQYIVMDTDLTVLAASAGSVALLGVDPTALAGRDTSLNDYAEELSAPGVLDELQSSNGLALRITVRAEEPDDRDGNGYGDDGSGSDEGSSSAAPISRAGGLSSRDLLISAGPQWGGDAGVNKRTYSMQRKRDSLVADVPVPGVSSHWLRQQRGSDRDAAPGDGPGGFSNRGGGGSAGTAHVWIRANLQSVSFEGLEALVLHWQRLDPAFIPRAEARRNALLTAMRTVAEMSGGGGGGGGGGTGGGLPMAALSGYHLGAGGHRDRDGGSSPSSAHQHHNAMGHPGHSGRLGLGDDLSRSGAFRPDFPEGDGYHAHHASTALAASARMARPDPTGRDVPGHLPPSHARSLQQRGASTRGNYGLAAASGDLSRTQWPPGPASEHRDHDLELVRMDKHPSFASEPRSPGGAAADVAASGHHRDLADHHAASQPLSGAQAGNQARLGAATRQQRSRPGRGGSSASTDQASDGRASDNSNSWSNNGSESQASSAAEPQAALRTRTGSRPSTEQLVGNPISLGHRDATMTGTGTGTGASTVELLPLDMVVDADSSANPAGRRGGRGSGIARRAVAEPSGPGTRDLASDQAAAAATAADYEESAAAMAAAAAAVIGVPGSVSESMDHDILHLLDSHAGTGSQSQSLRQGDRPGGRPGGAAAQLQAASAAAGPASVFAPGENGDSGLPAPVSEPLAPHAGAPADSGARWAEPPASLRAQALSHAGAATEAARETHASASGPSRPKRSSVSTPAEVEGGTVAAELVAGPVGPPAAGNAAAQASPSRAMTRVKPALAALRAASGLMTQQQALQAQAAQRGDHPLSGPYALSPGPRPQVAGSGFVGAGGPGSSYGHFGMGGSEMLGSGFGAMTVSSFPGPGPGPGPGEGSGIMPQLPLSAVKGSRRQGTGPQGPPSVGPGGGGAAGAAGGYADGFGGTQAAASVSSHVNSNPGPPVYSVSMRDTAGGGGGGGGGNAGLDDRSSHSGSTDTSTTGAVKALARLRRMLSDPNPPLLRPLRLLLIAGTGVALLSIALAIVMGVVTRGSFLAFFNNVRYASLGMDRLVAMSDALGAAQALRSHARQWLPLSGTSVEAHRGYILANTTAFSDAHLAMVDLIAKKDASGSSDASLYTQRYITVRRFDISASSVAGTNVVAVNLVEVGNMIATQLLQVFGANMSEIVQARYPPMRFLQTDGLRGGNALEALRRSTTLGYTATLASSASLQTTQITTFVVMSTVIILLAFGVFLPILWNIENSADLIQLQFVALPGGVRRAMLEQSMGRLRLLKRQFAEEGDDDDDDDLLDNDMGPEDGVVAVPVAGGGLGLIADAATSKGHPHAAVGPAPIMVVEDEGGAVDADWDRVLAGTTTGSAAASVRSSTERDIAYAGFISPGSFHGGGGGGMSAGSLASGSEIEGGGANAGRRSSDMGLNIPGHGPGSSSARLVGGSAAVAPGGAATPAGAVAMAPQASKETRRSRLRRASAKERSYRKSGRSFARMLCRFTCPLSLVILMFACVFGVFMVSLRDAQTLAAVATAAGMRQICAKEALIGMRALVGIPAEPQYVANRFSYTLSAFDCVRSHTRLLAFEPDPAMLSDPETVYASNVPPVENGQPSALSSEASSVAHTLMFADACEILTQRAKPDTGATLERCRAFSGGVMRHGVAALIEEVYAAGYRLAHRPLRRRFWTGSNPVSGRTWLEEGFGWEAAPGNFNYSAFPCRASTGCLIGVPFTRPPAGETMPPTVIPDPTWSGDGAGPPAPPPTNGSTIYSAADVLTSADMAFLREADAVYLTPALKLLANTYSEEAEDVISRFLLFLVIFLPLWCTGFVLVMAAWTMQVRRLNREIYTKRFFITLLPFQVVARIRAIRKLVDDILRRDDTPAAAKTVSTLSTGGRSSRSLA